MAKTTFTKLGCKMNKDEIPVQFNDQTFAVKQYLPINEKLRMIGRIVELSHNEQENYSNPIKVDVFTALEIMYNYTDISFTEKQKEEPNKLYDTVLSSGLLTKIYNNIPVEEIESIVKGVDKIITSVYQYQNSALGILDTIKTDYSNLDFNIEELKDKLAGAENLDIVKEVVDKMS